MGMEALDDSKQDENDRQHPQDKGVSADRVAGNEPQYPHDDPKIETFAPKTVYDWSTSGTFGPFGIAWNFDKPYYFSIHRLGLYKVLFVCNPQGITMRCRHIPSSVSTRSSLLKSITTGLACASVGMAMAVLIASYSNADDLKPPTRNERNVALLVARLMKGEHLSNRGVDDTISNRAFDLYLKMLDPLKVYFMQSDIDEFSKWKDKLDDQMEEGDFTAALDIFRRFLERIDQRTETALEMIDVEHDFMIDEEMATDTKLLQYAQNEAEARDAWRKRIKYSLLVLKQAQKDDKAKDDKAENKSDSANDTDPATEHADQDAAKPKAKPADDPQETLRKRYRSFARRMHQMNTEDVLEMYVTAVTTSFDPHTTYMSSRSYNNFLIQMGLELEGIGATLGATDEGYTVIKNIVKGGAAATQGGLKVEDRIVAVAQGDENGEKLDVNLARKNGLDFVDAVGMKLDDVVGMIRGKAGTVVRLQVMSENSSEINTITIVREKIKLEDSAAHGKVFEEGVRPDGTPRKIGVIDLPSFYADMGERGVGARSTTTDVRRILNEFKEQGVDVVVMDLRSNGGGSLQEAIDCTGLFIDYGTVVQAKDSVGRIVKHDDTVRGTSWGGPLVVVTSKFSASASEILAGAVQDYNRGIVVGDTTTHGKGTVQSVANLDRLIYSRASPEANVLGVLKITTQQFYRPNGESTQKRGVLSDIVLPSFTDKMDVSESDLDYPMEFDTVPSARIKFYDLVDEQIRERLAHQSSARISEDKDFHERVEKIKHYVEQKALKSVSLNEETFMARRAQLNSEKEDEQTIESQLNPDREIKRDFYLNEVLKIANDYADLLASRS